MLKVLKDLVLGEPAIALGIVSTGLGAWVAALVGAGEAVPIALAVAAPVSSAVAAVYTRQTVEPKHPSPLTRSKP